MADGEYNFSLTTFSPTGKLVQIEYALNRVSSSSPALGKFIINFFPFF